MAWRVPKGWEEFAARAPAPRFGGLSPRLAAVALQVPEGATVADVGTDHGKLVYTLVARRRVRRGFAVDRSSKALEGARTRLEFLDGAEALLGDGFEPLEPSSFDCATLAGLGGRGAVDIVARGQAAGHVVPRVIVQPLTSIDEVRAEMLALGYGLESETLVADGGRIYVTFVFDRRAGIRTLATDEDLFVGPTLASRTSPTEAPLLAPWLLGLCQWLQTMLTRDVAPPLRSLLERRLAAVDSVASRIPLDAPALPSPPVRH